MDREMNTRFAAPVAAAVALALVAPASAELAWGTTATGALLSFDTDNPGSPISGTFITGLQSNEEILGLDFRPADGQIYALGSFNNLYTITPATGQATLVSSLSGAIIDGAAFGFDFNPVADRLRIVSDTNQNLRVNPNVNPASALVDGALVYGVGDPNEGRDQDVSFAAYTNNVAGAQSTQLFVIDTDADVLALVSPPNDGVLQTRGPLGVDIGSRGGFDISGATGTAFVAALPTDSSTSNLYRINLDTGSLELVGEIAGGVELRTFTIVPAPSTALAFLAAGLLRRRSRR